MPKKNDGAAAPTIRVAVLLSTAILVLLATTPSARADAHRSSDVVPRAAPESQGFSPQRLERIDLRMTEAVRDGVMVGGQGLIARRGELIYNRTWGMADREMARPLSDDALYRIYSMTKPVTSVALLMLYEEGHFLLSDPVARYLPALADLQLARETADGEMELVTPTRQPTIRDLLRHSAGFSYGVFGNSQVDRQYLAADLLRSPSLAEFTARLGQLPLLLEPGTRWHYSVSVDVQARLIEVISGQRFSEFLQERIFAPLGMHDTFFTVPAEKQPRLTQLYSPRGTTLSWDKPWQFTDERVLTPADPELSRPYLDGSLFESGGAGLVSTAEDYLRFALMLAGDGAWNGVRLLAPRTVAHLRSDHIRELEKPGLYGLESFGLGVGVVSDPAGASGEIDGQGAYGWGGAAGTLFWVDPVDEIVGVFMVQSVPHQTSLSRKFRVLTYQALLD